MSSLAIHQEDGFDRSICNKVFYEKKKETYSLLDKQNSIRLLIKTLDNIIKTYNKCIHNKLSIAAEFDKISQVASLKKVKHASIHSIIGAKLSRGEELSLVELYQASNYYKN